jgi:hypothetical protein
MAIGPDGTIYVVGNTTTDSTSTIARIAQGVPDGSGGRIWSLLARTESYPRTQIGIFDHFFNGLIVSPDGQYIYANSGARTDHGEVPGSELFAPYSTDSIVGLDILKVLL